MVTMKSPAGSGGFGFNGEFYATDEKGFVFIPEDGVKDALIHGFKLYTEPPDEELQAARSDAEAKEEKANRETKKRML